MKKERKKQLIIYQAKNGKIEFRGDIDRETIWGTQKQIAEVFGIDRSVVTRHIHNILKTGEVDKKSNVQKMHIANSDKQVQFYSLDLFLAVGYRTNSAKAIEFRKWATDVLRKHLLDGYTINKKRIKQNYASFLQAVEDVNMLLPEHTSIQTKDILELIHMFAGTWFSLNSYDTETFPKKGLNKEKIIITAKELSEAIAELKKKLLSKKQATEIFAQERKQHAVEAIVGNVFQSLFGKNVYETVEEKAAHLLYFVVKNHPFVDGNKRTGAFCFVWFLNKAGILSANMTPASLTALTLLIAESNPKDKEKMTGLVLLLLQRK